MKTLFIEARKKLKPEDISNLAGIKSQLPEKLHMLYTIQYKNIAEKIKKELERKGIEVLAFNQVLGCSRIKPKAPLLLIGSGRFHALQIALSSGKEVFIYDSGKIGRVAQEETETQAKREKGRISSFLYSKNIGMLISTKPGQNRIKESLIIKQKLEEKYKDKQFCLFLADNINLEELENFNVGFWINTACPGLELDSRKVIGYEKIIKFKTPYNRS